MLGKMEERINKKEDSLKVGKIKLFVFIHFSLMIFCITFSLGIFKWMGLFELNGFTLEFLNVVFETVFIFISGLAGMGIYLLLIPTLRRVENEFIKLTQMEEKNE